MNFPYSAGRRRFLQTMLLLLGVSPGCNGKENKSKNDPSVETQDDPCASLEHLSKETLTAREALSYMAVSPYKDQLCDNCQYWIAPKEGQSCGACVTIQGPIHPKGYCSYWVPQL